MRFVVAAALLILAPIGWADDAPEEPKPQRIVAIEGGTVLTMTGAPVEKSGRITWALRFGSKASTRATPAAGRLSMRCSPLRIPSIIVPTFMPTM